MLWSRVVVCGNLRDASVRRGGFIGNARPRPELFCNRTYGRAHGLWTRGRKPLASQVVFRGGRGWEMRRAAYIVSQVAVC
jgi:hypothetical protein